MAGIFLAIVFLYFTGVIIKSYKRIGSLEDRVGAIESELEEKTEDAN